jgi:hypothetical protein
VFKGITWWHMCLGIPVPVKVGGRGHVTACMGNLQCMCSTGANRDTGNSSLPQQSRQSRNHPCSLRPQSLWCKIYLSI